MSMFLLSLWTTFFSSSEIRLFEQELKKNRCPDIDQWIYNIVWKCCIYIINIIEHEGFYVLMTQAWAINLHLIGLCWHPVRTERYCKETYHFFQYIFWDRLWDFKMKFSCNFKWSACFQLFQWLSEIVSEIAYIICEAVKPSL